MAPHSRGPFVFGTVAAVHPPEVVVAKPKKVVKKLDKSPKKAPKKSSKSKGKGGG